MKQQKNCKMWLWIIETHLSQSVTVSLSGCRDNNRLSPVLAADVFQVFLNGLQPGQLCREVNRRNARVVAVAVQLFLQGLVDFIQRAQEELRKRRQGGVTLACPKKVWFTCEKILCTLKYLVLLQGDLSPLEAQHQLCVFCPGVTVLCHLFDLFWQIPAAKTRVIIHIVWSLSVPFGTSSLHHFVQMQLILTCQTCALLLFECSFLPPLYPWNKR